MNRGSTLLGRSRAVGAETAFFTFWIGGLGYCFLLIVLILLQRLGLPLFLVLSGLATFTTLGLIALSWQGRTMSSRPFYFVSRIISPSQIGLAGTADWFCGSVLLLFVSLPFGAKIIFAPALMLGILLQAVLFSGAFQKSHVVTVPGFFAWRSLSKTVGIVVLAVVSAVLACLIIAEFQILLAMLENLGLNPGGGWLWFILALVVIASMTGGWQSLVLVNGLIAIAILTSLLLTAASIAFFPDFLRSILELAPNLQSLPPLPFPDNDPFGFLAALNQAKLDASVHEKVAPAVALLVLAAGFSCLPHALSRAALNNNSVAAAESVGWSALFAFLVLSALPLSTALVAVTPSSRALAALLQQHTVLYGLAHFVILLAAFNALTVTLFALSAAVVRGLRRTRSLDPGEQSMFAVRLLTVIGAFSLPYVAPHVPWDFASLVFLALSLVAGSLFAPMVFSIWFSRIPWWALALSVTAGAMTTLLGLAGYLPLPGFYSGFEGIIASAAVLTIGRLWIILLRRKPVDETLITLRQRRANAPENSNKILPKGA